MSWTSRPTNFSLEVVKKAESQIKKISAEMLQQVIVGSPVDTGAFRGNHHITLGSPDNAFDLTAVDKDGGTTQQKGNQKILQAKIGGLIYIQNNLPYAVALENGHSQQMAHGIYSIAFMKVMRKYK